MSRLIAKRCLLTLAALPVLAMWGCKSEPNKLDVAAPPPSASAKQEPVIDTPKQRPMAPPGMGAPGKK